MFTITIDGLSGSGRSSLSRNLAKLLNFQHIEEDLIFNTMAYIFIHKKYESLGDFFENQDIDLKFTKNRIIVSNMDLTSRLNSKDVTDLAQSMRDDNRAKNLVYKLQKPLADEFNTIFTGKNQGKIFFPSADLKFFITASLDKRVKRRLADHLSIVNKLTYDYIANDIEKKDLYDLERGNFMIPQDIIKIDNSEDDMLKTLEMIVEIVKSRI